jgi:DinB superfamily
MNIKDSIKASLRISDALSQSYLEDITPDEMFIQPVPDANHIAWQLGHLITSEHRLIEAAAPNSMPALPEEFSQKYRRDMAPSPHPGDYLTKEEYLQMARQVRAGTIAALESVSDDDFARPVTGRVPPFIKSVLDCFATIGPHWSLHAGQWVIIRRKLGRARMF